MDQLNLRGITETTFNQSLYLSSLASKYENTLYAIFADQNKLTKLGGCDRRKHENISDWLTHSLTVLDEYISSKNLMLNFSENVNEIWLEKF